MKHPNTMIPVVVHLYGRVDGSEDLHPLGELEIQVFPTTGTGTVAAPPAGGLLRRLAAAVQKKKERP